MSYAIHVFAAIGVFAVFLLVVKPLVWCALYATGLLIFEIRVARADGRRTRIPAWTAAKHWGRHFLQAMTWPASGVNVGRLEWKPLFNYRGFTGTSQENQHG